MLVLYYFFLHKKLNKDVILINDVMEKDFQVCTFENDINIISKCSQTFGGCSAAGMTVLS